MKLPHEYPKRILLLVTGMSPQIVTETLYALSQNTSPAFIPTEIHLISTAEGVKRAKLELLKGQDPKFKQFVSEYKLPEILFDDDCFHVLKDEFGTPLSDIRTESDNMAAADQLNDIVKAFTSSENETSLHVSIAGGRKTMGYYLGYSLSLWGREQDRLSHVLVSEGYESHPEFWYPTIESHIIRTYKDEPLDTSEAIVTLADIPFVRLRPELPKKALVNKYSFKDTVELLQPVKDETVVFDYANGCVITGGRSIKLEKGLLAFYGWLGRRKVDGESGFETPLTVIEEGDIYNNWQEAFFDELELIDRMFERDDVEGNETVGALTKGMDEPYIRDKKTKLKSALEKELGIKNYRLFAIQMIKEKDKANLYQLRTDVNDISWV